MTSQFRGKNLMKGRILLIPLLLSGFLLGCQPDREAIFQGRIWGETSNGLRCSIAIEEIKWPKGSPALVSVIIENVSESKVNLETIPAFKLNENKLETIPAFKLNENKIEYWCPVDIAEEGHALPPNARSIISLEKASFMDLRMDLSKLKWGMSLSAIWPENSFYLVSPGRYKLSMDIEIVGGGLPEWIRSNEVEVSIGE
jgi:hypothetical protein